MTSRIYSTIIRNAWPSLFSSKPSLPGASCAVQLPMKSMQCNSMDQLLVNKIKSSSIIVMQTQNLHNYYRARIQNPFKYARSMRVDKDIKFPEDGVYTVEHLPVRKLAGRDPVTGRLVLHNLGGGRKINYRWVDHHRYGPTEEGKFLEERIIAIEKDPNRTAHIALVASGNHMRYLIATTSMKAGDIIKTSSYIPSIPVRPIEGNAYPIGAFPSGAKVCCVEPYPGFGLRYSTSAGASGTVTGREDGRVIVKFKKRLVYSLDPKCMAVSGQVSNELYHKEIIGSAARKRWLGKRPRLGLKVKKDGHAGRKIKGPRPIRIVKPKEPPIPTIMLTCKSFGPNKLYVPGFDRRNKF